MKNAEFIMAAFHTMFLEQKIDKIATDPKL